MRCVVDIRVNRSVSIVSQITFIRLCPSKTLIDISVYDNKGYLTRTIGLHVGTDLDGIGYQARGGESFSVWVSQ